MGERNRKRSEFQPPILLWSTTNDSNNAEKKGARTKTQ